MTFCFRSSRDAIASCCCTSAACSANFSWSLCAACVMCTSVVMNIRSHGHPCPHDGTLACNTAADHILWTCQSAWYIGLGHAGSRHMDGTHVSTEAAHAVLDHPPMQACLRVFMQRDLHMAQCSRDSRFSVLGCSGSPLLALLASFAADKSTASCTAVSSGCPTYWPTSRQDARCGIETQVTKTMHNTSAFDRIIRECFYKIR